MRLSVETFMGPVNFLLLAACFALLAALVTCRGPLVVRGHLSQASAVVLADEAVSRELKIDPSEYKRHVITDERFWVIWYTPKGTSDEQMKTVALVSCSDGSVHTAAQ